LKKIFIVVNVDWFFLSHRLPIALKALDQGYDVTIIAKDTGRSCDILKYRLSFINIPVSRSGISFLAEMRTVYQLFRIYLKNKPDIVHHVTLKISIYGSIAARFAKIKRVINAISGLGYNFTNGRESIINRVLFILMKYAFKSDGGKFFIFQNKDDSAYFLEKGLVTETNYKIIKGSGVDLKKFYFSTTIEKQKLKILLSARMLYDKGVVEFINASKILYENYNNKIEFVLAGPLDYDNPASINETKLRSYLVPGYLTWIGYSDNIIYHLRDSDIVILPSYREGIPKSLIEACAVGRPIITADAVGCRECVIEGYNGFLVPLKDEKVLAQKIEILVNDSDLRRRMGIASRDMAVKYFSLDDVVLSTLSIYKKLLENN
jgi:glycosyltransferase involved in cell wall biosynthesis